MISATTPLLGFSGEISWSLGQISLMVSLGDGQHSTSTTMNFMVVRSPSPYNGISGRPGLRKIQAVLSTTHGMLKYPVEGKIVTIRSNTIIPAESRMVAGAPNRPPPQEPTAMEGIKVAIHLEYKYMTCVPRSIVEHHLNIREGCQPIRQKRRGQALDMNKEIQEEVTKLVEAEIIREVHYHDWLSNLVMNAGTTYQRLVDKAFEKQIGRNLEVYVDDLVIKIHTEHEILRDIKETFHNLRRINMKLNLKNAHSVRKRGAFPEATVRGKVTTLLQDPKKVHEKIDFQWTPEAERAFQGMKQCIAELPMVTAPRPKEELIMYLCAAREAVSAVLLVERDSQQIPVYFVSRALQAPEINYNLVENWS
ncbi:reverse transcriptase domain-containing protein [Tanacetum coccineum]